MKLNALIEWSKNEFSDLPWRKNRSLYRTLVSEIMLQQTTVGTVKNHYERFLKQFPTLSSLAEATEDELIVAWKGLGYYRRARNLKKIAETIHAEFNDEFPQDIETLKTISGIGPYTASAIVGIGMDKRALAVDANLERVIARLFNIKTEKGPKLQAAIGELFHFVILTKP
jgi:A/G-specific adenine glycosylase